MNSARSQIDSAHFIKDMIINFIETHGDLDLTNPESCKLWDELACNINWRKSGKHLGLSKKHYLYHLWCKMKSDVEKKVEKHIAHNKNTRNTLLGRMLKLSPSEIRIANILGINKAEIVDSEEVKTNVHLTAKAYYFSRYLEAAKGDLFKARSKAAASWLNLPAEKKEVIILKHKEAQNLRRQKIADYLSAVELNSSPPPPPPANPDSSTSQRNEVDVQVDGVHINESDTDEEMANSQETNLCSNNITTSDNLGESTEHIDANIEDNNSSRHNISRDDEIEPPPPPPVVTSRHNISRDDEIEPPPPPPVVTSRHNISRDDEIEPPPPPPVVTTAEELYDLIQKTHEIEERPWKSLPEAEKRQFRTAIIRLKKDYLRQYRSYLHNLSSMDLHKHMVQTVLNDLS